MNDGNSEREGNPTPPTEDTQKGEQNFISRFFNSQKKTLPAEVAIEHDFMKDAIKPDPSIDPVLAREHGRINPAGLDLTGKEMSQGLQGIHTEKQAVPIPPITHESKPNRPQAVSKREISKKVGRRRVLKSLMAGAAVGAVAAYPAIKTAEAGLKILAAAANHPGEQLRKQAADDEEKRRKFATETNQPFQYNGEIMNRLTNDNDDKNKP